MWNLIKDNEFDHLKEALEGQSISGIAHLNFENIEEDEEILTLADDKKLMLSHLNPILLAVKSKSINCL